MHFNVPVIPNFPQQDMMMHPVIIFIHPKSPSLEYLFLKCDGDLNHCIAAAAVLSSHVQEWDSSSPVSQKVVSPIG